MKRFAALVVGCLVSAATVAQPLVDGIGFLKIGDSEQYVKQMIAKKQGKKPRLLKGDDLYPSSYRWVYEDLAFSINDQNERFPVVMFTLSDGQFDVCHPEGCKVNYKLDDDMIMTIDGMQTSSTNIVGCSERLMEAHGGIGGCMLQNLALYQPIINGAKKLIVEIDIFGYGNAQFKFNVSGLQPWKKWDGLAVPMTY